MVLDCSVVMAWCFEDDTSGYADKIFHFLGEHIGMVPTLWPLEVANVLAMAERRKKVTETKILHFVEWLSSLNLQVDRETPDRAMHDILSLAREHGLTAYDASYLELAMRKAAPLATLDEALLKAAVKAGVRLMRG